MGFLELIAAGLVAVVVAFFGGSILGQKKEREKRALRENEAFTRGVEHGQKAKKKLAEGEHPQKIVEKNRW